MEEWTASGSDGGGWTFKAGVLSSETPGGIAREIAFPMESSVAFDASWRGAFKPRIILFSDNINTDNPETGYELVFQGRSVHVKKCGSNNWLGHTTNAGELQANEKARIEIKASKKSGKIALYVDGNLIEIWEDDEADGEKFGNGFHLISQESSPLQISEISVTDWDGYLEDDASGRRIDRGQLEFEENDESAVEVESVIPEGRMVMRNGDTIEGEVIAIEGEEIKLQTKFSEVRIPISRLKNILLKTAEMETPKRYKGDVRATLADGTRMVIRFDGVKGDRIVGFSQNFGGAEFRKDAFKRIEFNLYDDAMDRIRAGAGM